MKLVVGFLVAFTASAFAEPLITVAPQTAHRGDPVLVTVTGVHKVPEGKAGGRPLVFFPSVNGYQALFAVPLKVDEQFDVIVSNPPYVESEIIEQLQPDVRDFDPLLALDGGADGLFAYRSIAEQALNRLKPNGTLLLEVGSEQGLEVGALFSNAGFTSIDIRKDLAGLDRVVIGHHVSG